MGVSHGAPAELRVIGNAKRQQRGLTLAAEVSAYWSYLLTESPPGYPAEYERRFPEAGATLKAHREGVLPTVARNFVCWWLRSAKRFLTAKELAALSGFPVTKAQAQAGQVLPDPSANDYEFSHTGKCMHVGSVGMVLAVAWACLCVMEA